MPRAGNWVDRSCRPRCGPICACRAPTGRSAPGCCSGHACWGVALAAADQEHGAFPICGWSRSFVVGAIVMRGAGCTYNDIVDRDIDAKVARTASRPLPSGQVSVERAIAWMVHSSA